MRVHFIQHESFEGPGVLANWCRARGYEASYTRLWLGESLPQSLQGVGLLVVLGGPQSPATGIAECHYFDARAEQALIARAIAGQVAVLGICLGAQLIGEALGASFEPSPEVEIGFFPVTLTAAGRAHPGLESFGDSVTLGHWHHDMPGLTADSKVLAFSEVCPRQIVEYGARVFGFQCHLEFDAEAIEALISHSAAEFGQPRPWVQSPDVLRQAETQEMNVLLWQFLDWLVR
ncbi:glutamine amidotransferase-related protein [Shewanella algae]|uniref:glutamine amidotransferase-related protein n=1 Tax=Shewanella algae TaxID=38313 RepID=UPI000D1379D9|nr:glutamine amidotransferase [Shewanella algae]PSS68473.1 GMP synthase [Shewanella algae]TVL06136.1 GMP synthase [Shewanella algae]TVL53899.1 GMP synthase [Shewanella algae]